MKLLPLVLGITTAAELDARFARGDIGLRGVDMERRDLSSTCVYCEALLPTGIKNSLADIVSDALESLDRCTDKDCVKDMTDFVETICKNEEKYGRITKDQGKLLEDFIKDISTEQENAIKEEEKAKKEAEKQGKKAFAEPRPPPKTPPCPYCSILEHAECSHHVIMFVTSRLAQMRKCETEDCAKTVEKILDNTRKRDETNGKIDEYQSKVLKDIITKSFDEKKAEIKAAEELWKKANSSGSGSSR